MLVLGDLVSGLGTQAALVALPYQLYTQTHSALLVGLLGAVELVPLVSLSLVGGAIADRRDRRRLLLQIQIALVLLAGALAVLAAAGEPPVPVLYVLGALLGGFGSMQNVTRSAIVPNVVAPEFLRSALAVNFGLYQLTMVLDPGLGGLLIAAGGVSSAYAVDAISCGAMVWAVFVMSPQPPSGVAAGDELTSVRRSIGEGLRFVRGNRALLGSFAIDLSAMTFGMPRALFAVLSVSTFHAGAAGTGLLYAAVSVGATIAALTTRWLEHARRLGLVVIWAVLAWGLAIAGAGLAPTIWIAALLLAVAGAADSVSAVCRSTINQTVTPDALRGRMSSVFSVVVAGGPRLGDVESGVAAAVTSARVSFVSGGLACVAAVGAVMVAFPQLLAYDAEVALAEMAEAAEPQPAPD